MAGDISREVQRLAAARTPTGAGFVVFAPADIPQLTMADIVLLRNADEGVVPARFMGMIVAGTNEENIHEQVQLLRVSSDGVPLGTLLDDAATEASPGSRTHTWGAIGLPDGPVTRVRRLGEDPVVVDDVAVAHASAGHRRYRTDRSISITPGDIVHVGGIEARLIAVDRRARTAEIDVGDEVREVGLFEIDDLERDA